MNKDVIEVGDFIAYKDHIMAVIDIDEEYAYVMSNDDHHCKRLPKDKLEKMKIVKKAACNSIIRAFFDDMTYIR